MNKDQLLTLATLFKNVVIRKKKYVLKFYAKSEEGLWKRWYYDWNKNHKCTWGFEEGNLGMVAGADKLCEKYAKGKNEVTVNIIVSRNEITPPIGYVMYKINASLSQKENLNVSYAELTMSVYVMTIIFGFVQ